MRVFGKAEIALMCATAGASLSCSAVDMPPAPPPSNAASDSARVVVAQRAVSQYGRFEGRVVTVWLPNGRNMELVEPFIYIDGRQVQWDAPKGTVVDGASIPKMAWSIIGGPFEGKYRNASVIHDVACVRKDRTWQAVHEAFYNAMLASDVDETTAKVMYAAVYHFGPRWDRKLPRIQTTADNATSLGEQIAEKNRLPGEVSMIATRIVRNPIVASPSPPSSPYPPSTAFPSSPPQSSPGLADIEISFTAPKTLGDAEFEQLKAQIQSQNLSLEQIQAYSPPPR